MASQYKNPLRVMWAVDAFEEAEELHRRSVEVLREMERDSELLVEPVYVLNPGQLNLSMEFSAPWLEQYRPAAEKALEALCQDLKISAVARPHVLIQNFSTTTQAVDGLIRFAHGLLSDLILVNTHGRSGMKRFFLGSFAETLLLRSDVPVLTVGPGMADRGAQGVDARLDSILFPTEFHAYSKDRFKEVIQLAKKFHATVTLFHAIPHPVEPVFQSGVYLLGGAWIPVQAYFSREVEHQTRRANIWAKWANDQGVKTRTVIETQAVNISDAIIDLAGRKKIGLIVMEAHSGAISAAILGSVTRQVVRHASCPVWVLKPGYTEETAKKAA